MNKHVDNCVTCVLASTKHLRDETTSRMLPQALCMGFSQSAT